MDTKKKRYSKTTVRALAWAAGGVAFAIPWVAFEFVPAAATNAAQSSTPQVIVVPAGSKVTVLSAPSGGAGVKIIHSASGTATAPTVKSAPVTTTGASAPPP